MNSLLKSLLILLCFCISVVGFAQDEEDLASDHKAYKKGVKFFKKENYLQAGEQFQILIDSGYRDHDLIAYQAQVHLELHEPHAAKDVLLLPKERTQDLDYLLAISHYYLEEFEEAFVELSFVTDTAAYHVNEMHDKIAEVLRHYQDAKGYTVQNFGPEVNTKFQEYAAVMLGSYDELLFTTRNDTSEYTAHDGMAFETIHDTKIDSLNQWHVSDPFEFHTGHEKAHDATVQIYQGGKKLITYHNGHLFKSHLVDNVWEEDGPLDIHGFDAYDTHCYLADDESYVIFASDYHSYGHNLDLFVSYRLEDSTWSEPERIEELNTEFDEDSPFLAEDSTLYFSSRGHGSLGGYDIFKSTYDHKNKRWGKPVNLDYPINTVAEDIYYSTYGEVAFFSSTRPGGYGSLDLYRVLLFNEFMIEGYLIDDHTKKAIPYAQIDIEYDSLYFRSYTDSTGHYELFVPVNKDMVVTFLDEDHKKIHSEKYWVDVFFRDKDDRRYDFHIPWEQAPPVYKEMHGDATLIHVEMVNDFQSHQYLASVSHHNIQHWSDSLKNFYEARRLEHFVARPGTVTVYFDHNSSELSQSVKNVMDELNKNVLSKREFKIEVSGHTDVVGAAWYNERLSLQRAQRAAEYLYKLGVPKEKVVAKGYGESKLLDKTESESANAKNRRVEIKFSN